MLQTPEKLFRKATDLGFNCSTNWQEHCIQPADADANWQLIYKNGNWILLVNGVPQMHLKYSEVIAFLERRSSSREALAGNSLLTASSVRLPVA